MKIDDDTLADAVVAAGRASVLDGRDHYCLADVIHAMCRVDDILERDGVPEADDALSLAIWAWRMRDAEIPY